jgi:AcrR family transcriptional regulator
MSSAQRCGLAADTVLCVTPRSRSVKTAPDTNDARVSATPRTRKALVEAQILEAATELFAARGFAGTSLQDVAEATGLTRPAIYHYFSSKEDLLSRLVSEVTVGPAADLRRIRRSAEMPVVDRLREMAASIALLQAQHPARFRMLIRSEADLPQGLADTYADGRRSVLREFSSLIEEGVASGDFRPVDPRTAALGIIGLCNWVAWWHRPGDDTDDRRVAVALADMAVASVMSNDVRVTDATGVDRVLELLKQDVAALERLTRRPGAG